MKWRDSILEHVAYIVVFLVLFYAFVCVPFARSLGWM